MNAKHLFVVDSCSVNVVLLTKRLKLMLFIKWHPQERNKENPAKSLNGPPRQDTRQGTRFGTRNGAQHPGTRETIRLPPLNPATTNGLTYYKGRYKDLYNVLIPRRPETLHMWRDLAFNVRHDNNLVTKPYRSIDIIKR